MEWVQQVSDDEMIAVFLQAEVDSKLFGARVRSALQQLGGSLPMLQAPDVTNEDLSSTGRRIISGM